MKIHPLASKMPPMTTEEYAALVEDIRATGRVLDPVWTYEGMILDGVHRYRAAQEAGVEPEFREFDHGMDPWAFVISKNIVRRHLVQGQRAMMVVEDYEATKTTDWSDAAKKGWETRLSDHGPEGRSQETRDQLGQKYSIGGRTIGRAVRVYREDAALADKVLAGQVTLGTAEGMLAERAFPPTPPEVRERRQKDEAEKDRYRNLPETKTFLENIQRSIRIFRAGWQSAKEEKIDRRAHLPYLIKELKHYRDELDKIIRELEALRDG